MHLNAQNHASQSVNPGSVEESASCIVYLSVLFRLMLSTARALPNLGAPRQEPQKTPNLSSDFAVEPDADGERQKAGTMTAAIAFALGYKFGRSIEEFGRGLTETPCIPETPPEGSAAADSNIEMVRKVVDALKGFTLQRIIEVTPTH